MKSFGAMVRFKPDPPGDPVEPTPDAAAHTPDVDQFRAVFDEAADAMLILDSDRRIVAANRAAIDLFALPAHPAGERIDGRFAGDDGTVQTVWRDVLTSGQAKQEHRVLSADQARLVECSYRARVHGPDRHLCIARDITERRLLEERLAQSEKVESVGRLAGGIAHDFNNLLTAILGYTELLLSKHPGTEDLERLDLEEIQKAGQRAASLTQQLLAYSRKQVLQPRDVDLNRTIANLQSMLTRLIREDISLVCDLTPDMALVKIDPTQLEQVILNLVLNSRDALPTGGVIRLEVARVRGSEANLPLDHGPRAASYIRLRVADNGVGIPPEIQARIFEPFFTTKELGKGTGLGLASVYGIVRQSNGVITVESEAGHGTTFTMHFPAVDAPASADGHTPTTAEAAGGQETILLVEDEDAVRVIISTVLRRQGYRVLDAASPRAACELFDEHAASIDLLLTDVVMPEMNGPALAQRLIAARPDLRVLFISGYSDLKLPLDAENSNMSFLSKPFQASVLTAKVREVLSRPGGRRVLAR